MKFNRLLCVFIVLISVSATLAVSQNEDESSATGNGTQESPITKTISIYKGEHEEVYFAFNLSSFDFDSTGDGYVIEIQGEGVPGTTRIPIVKVGGNFRDWSTIAPRVLETDDYAVDISKVDNGGLFCFTIYMINCVRISFDVKVTVISYGFEQYAYYRFVANPIQPKEYSITFDSPAVDVNGSFLAHGTLFVDGQKVDDLSNYKFYAKGLNRGVSIHNNLTISGRVDLTDSCWSTGTMSPSIVVSNTTGERLGFANANISYTIDNTVPGLNFKVFNGEELILDQSRPLAPITIFAGTDLSVYVSGGSRATVLFEDEKGFKETTVYTSRLTSDTASLITSGVGTYTILFSHMYSDQVAQVQIHIIASLVPVNNIIVTCAPAN